MKHYLVLAASVVVTLAAGFVMPERWSDAQRDVIVSLRLGALEPLSADPSNRYADDARAAELGRRLFFDARFSANGKVACATCHDPAKEFQDGTPLGRGVGVTGRRTMPVASTARGEWMFWDGRKDSQWSQALGPLESPVEHGGTRAQYAHLIASNYRAEYEAVFGRLPDLSRVPRIAGPVDDSLAAAAWGTLAPATRDTVSRVFANMGKAIAAYERQIQYGPSRFDRYADVLAATGEAPTDILTRDELAGLRLFIGRARCATCHNGPLFTDQHFHNTGVPAAAGLPADAGRARGVALVATDEFNCRSRYSDAAAGECPALDFLAADSPDYPGAFKTPSLRNVAGRGPYMHAGQLATLDDVVRHYDRAPAATIGHSELRGPLQLTGTERRQLVAFLGSLSAPLIAPAPLQVAPVQP